MPRSKRERVLLFVCFALLLTLVFPVNPVTAASKKMVIDEVLDILKSKKIISEKKYIELKKQLKAEQEEALTTLKKTAETAPANVEVGYKRGFYLKTRDNAFSLKLGGRVNFDYRQPFGDTDQDSTFKLRRARIYVKGMVWKYFSFKLQEEFASTATLKDAFLGIRLNKAFRFKVGQFKAPFSLSAMSSSLWMHLPERPITVDALAPYRDYGVMLHGNPWNGRVHYAVGVFNGTRGNKTDTDGSKDVAGRVVLSPFHAFTNIFIKGFHVGGSFTYGHENMNLNAQRGYWWNKGTFKSPGGVSFYKLADDVSMDGDRFRWGAELYWDIGPFALQGEWMQLTLNNLRDVTGIQNDVTLKGGYLSASYFLTGEDQPMKGGKLCRVSPKHPFNPGKYQWGAWELALRYDYFKLDSTLMSAHYAAQENAYTDKLWGITGGVNWWLNDMGMVRFSVSHIKFDDPVKDIGKDKENLALVRFQVVW